VAGDHSIADMMVFPWIVRARSGYVRRWMKRTGARRAVKRGMRVPDLSRLASRVASARASLADSS
jgi:glutathione S-transferase